MARRWRWDFDCWTFPRPCKHWGGLSRGRCRRSSGFRHTEFLAERASTPVGTQSREDRAGRKTRASSPRSIHRVRADTAQGLLRIPSVRRWGAAFAIDLETQGAPSPLQRRPGIRGRPARPYVRKTESPYSAEDNTIYQAAENGSRFAQCDLGGSGETAAPPKGDKKAPRFRGRH